MRKPGMLNNEADVVWYPQAKPFPCFISVQEKQISPGLMSEQLFYEFRLMG